MHTLNQLRALPVEKSAWPNAGTVWAEALRMLQAAQSAVAGVSGAQGNVIHTLPVADVLYL